MIRMIPLVPKGKIFDANALLRAVENGLDAAAKGAQVDFGVTTQTWQHRPSFAIERAPGQRVIATTDEIYGYVDAGTRPHLIRPRSASRLAFRYPTRAKTTPRRIGSNRGSIGKNWAFAKVVQHPGTAPREFTDVIGDKWGKQLPIVLQRALNAVTE